MCVMMDPMNLLIHEDDCPDHPSHTRVDDLGCMQDRWID